MPQLSLMREMSSPRVQVKAAGGVRTLDDLPHIMSLDVTRIGAMATVKIMEDAMALGIHETPRELRFKPIQNSVTGGY